MNPHVVERLIDAAKTSEIPYQLAACGRATGTDANAIQISRAAWPPAWSASPTATCTARSK